MCHDGNYKRGKVTALLTSTPLKGQLSERLHLCFLCATRAAATATATATEYPMLVTPQKRVLRRRSMKSGSSLLPARRFFFPFVPQNSYEQDVPFSVLFSGKYANETPHRHAQASLICINWPVVPVQLFTFFFFPRMCVLLERSLARLIAVCLPRCVDFHWKETRGTLKNLHTNQFWRP